MSGCKTPPLGDFQQYEGLISTQGGHFGDLGQRCTGQCAVSDGLDGLLYLIQPFVSESAQFFEEKIAQCGRGMNLVESKVKQTSADDGGTDQDIAAGLRGLYPTPLLGFPDLGAMNLPRLCNFQDQDVDLKTDNLTSAHDDTLMRLTFPKRA